MFLDNYVVLAAVFIFTFEGALSEKLKTSYKYQQFDENTEIHLTSPFAPDSNSLAYALCEHEKGVCEVFIETFNFDNTTNKLSCEVSVPLDDYVEVSNLANERIALYWVDSSNTAVILLLNVQKCSEKVVKVEISPSSRPKNFDVVLHKQTFDVFFKGGHEVSPRSYMSTYNYKGQRINGPIQSAQMDYYGVTSLFGRKESYRFPVEKNSPDKGYYCFYENDRVISAIVIFPDNKKKELISLDQGTIHELALSASNELFGLCYQPRESNSVTCVQYNAVGTTLLRIKYEIPEGSSINSMRIYNLVEGGFLMITGRCHIFVEEHCTKFKDFFVQKFTDDENKLYKKVKVRLLDEPLKLQDISIFEQDDDYCLFALYKNTFPLDKAYLKTIIKCFPKKSVNFIDFD